MGIPQLTGGILTLPINYPNKLLHSCSCKRRFQVTTGDSNATGINDAVETVLAVPDLERDLISNVHLKQDRYITLYACSSGSGWEWETEWKRKNNGFTVTLLDILQQQISRSDYAFLFAGQTSIGDEEVSDEAVHLAAATLAAGYRGVWKKHGLSRISMSPRFHEITSGDTSGEVDESEGDAG
jgi:hypothetical protein